MVVDLDWSDYCFPLYRIISISFFNARHCRFDSASYLAVVLTTNHSQTAP